ncbi:hypothetical protein [Yoonia sp. R2-816]
MKQQDASNKTSKGRLENSFRLLLITGVFRMRARSTSIAHQFELDVT